MKQLIYVLFSAALLAGCGMAPGMTGSSLTGPSGQAEAAASNLFAGLKDVKVVQGAPSDWYVNTVRYVDAKTAKNGRIWILDDRRDGVRVLHNTQDVTNAKKLAQLVAELESQASAAQTRTPALAVELREFIALLKQ